MRIQNVVWLSAKGEHLSGSLDIVDGRWSAVTERPPLPKNGAPENGPIELIVPGLVDTHVHFREPGLVDKEGIDRGTRAALAGGVTTILEMPNTVPPCATLEAFAEKRALYAAKARTHWGLHIQATATPVPFDLALVASAKVYMAKSSLREAILEQSDLEAIFEAYPRVAVHAEDESKFCPARYDEAARAHHLVRPVEAITSALAKLEAALIATPERQRPRLILCHSTTREEVAWVRRMKASGFDVWAETCPHYLLLTSDDYVARGNALKVNPPLRSGEDDAALFEALVDGTIDFISTDHAPHLPEEKAKTRGAPSGIAGIEALLPLVWSFVEEGKLTPARFHEACITAAARCYGINQHGAIHRGNYADFVVLKERAAKLPSPPITGAGWHPYLERSLPWRVARTYVAGALAYDEGGFPEPAVRGKEVYP